MTDQLVHPGTHIREAILPKGMSVTHAARLLGVGRPALSNLLNGNAALSPEMAARLAKAFGADADELLRMQAAHDRKAALEREPEIAVRAFVPPFLSISAHHIEAWAAELDARAELAVLLRRLVASTGVGLTKIDFPGYDNAQRPGWDGVVVSESVTPWIPKGESGWEFGCDERPGPKADGDYVSRTAKEKEARRKNTTFIFVTPRNWSGKEKWAEAKRARAEWRDVRAYDASDVEQWLEQSIPAQAWFAERLPMPKVGVQSLEKAWQQWAAVTEPPLSRDFFRASLATTVESLAKWLQAEPQQPFTVVAESPGEALAFLACAFDAEPLAALSASERAVVVRSAEALAQVSNISNRFIAVIASGDAERESAGIQRHQHTIVVTNRNAIEGEPNVTLDLVDEETFRETLRRMRVSDEKIDQLRHEAGYSLTVLRRRLSNVPEIKRPPWASDALVARRLIPLVLVGAWDSAGEADRAILTDLTSSTDQEIEQTVAELVGGDDSPVWSVGHFRGIVSKIDAFHAVQGRITADDLKRFFRVARVVLAETDPALELPKDRRWAANLYGKSRRHSAALRQGLCETLVLLATHGDRLFKSRTGLDVEALVNSLIRELLLPLDPTTWQSQQNDLPRYAEAAPDTFLAVLEEDLRSADPKVLALMQPADRMPFGGCSRTGLLWALENLTWSDRWLPRVVAILGRLARIRITDNWANTPENSLKAIFRWWCPQTAAPIDRRIAALDMLVKKEPEVGWRVCIEQFDPQATIGHFASRPRWRSDAQGTGGWPSVPDRRAMMRKAIEVALAWPRKDERKLGDLIDRLHGLPPKEQDQVWSAIRDWASSNPGDTARAALRERVRTRTMTRRRPKANWAPRTSKMARSAYEMLTPSDAVIREQWLFAKQWVEESVDELIEDASDYHSREERVRRQRGEALREILREAGYEGIVRLCTSGEGAGVIGWLLSSDVFDSNDALAFVIRVLADDRAESRAPMNWCLSSFLGRMEPLPRADFVGRVLAETKKQPSKSTERCLRLLINAPVDAVTWLFVENLPKTAQRTYWCEIVPAWGPSTPDEVNRMVRELLAVDRPRAAFRAVEMKFRQVEPNLLSRLLLEAATNTSEPEGHYKLDPHYISDAFKALSSRPEFSREELVRLEFLYITALDHTEHGIRNLEQQISEDPDLFIQALVLAYKRDDGEEDPPELRPQNETNRSGLITAAYRLLSSIRRVPGTRDDRTIDEAKLRDWVIRARSLALDCRRQTVADSLIGQLLANCPAGEDGVWPCEAVREVLEDLGTSDISRGMIIGVSNSRGAHYRGKDGQAERDLSAKYRGWARAVAVDHPFSSRMLDGLADMYVRDAAWEDDEAKIRQRLSH